MKSTCATVNAYRKLDFRLLDDRAADEGRYDAGGGESTMPVGEVSKFRMIVVPVETVAELRRFSEG